ncbi:MAG: hypothetical protein KGI66_01880, partial [Patescibacteria group bacterium]|nr:hypothetical protein [Patescibacteria group bacterium]
EERTEIRDERELVARLAFLLKRLLHGEEANSRLFDAIASAADFLDGHGSTGEQLKTLESVTVLRMLDALGYIGSGSSIDEQMRSGPITTELLESLGPKRLAMNRQINQALKESHL